MESDYVSPQKRPNSKKGSDDATVSESTEELLRELEQERILLQNGKHPDLLERVRILDAVRQDAITRAELHRKWRIESTENLHKYQLQAAEQIYGISIAKATSEVSRAIERRAKELRGKRQAEDRGTRRTLRNKTPKTNHQESEKATADVMAKGATEAGVLRPSSVLKFSMTAADVLSDMKQIHSDWQIRMKKFKSSFTDKILPTRVQKGTLYFCDEVIKSGDDVVVVSELTAQEFFGVVFAMSHAEVAIMFPDGSRVRLPLQHLRHGRFTIRKFTPQPIMQAIADRNAPQERRTTRAQVSSEQQRPASRSSRSVPTPSPPPQQGINDSHTHDTSGPHQATSVTQPQPPTVNAPTHQIAILSHSDGYSSQPHAVQLPTGTQFTVPGGGVGWHAGTTYQLPNGQTVLLGPSSFAPHAAQLLRPHSGGQNVTQAMSTGYQIGLSQVGGHLYPQVTMGYAPMNSEAAYSVVPAQNIVGSQIPSTAMSTLNESTPSDHGHNVSNTSSTTAVSTSPTAQVQFTQTTQAGHIVENDRMTSNIDNTGGITDQNNAPSNTGNVSNTTTSSPYRPVQPSINNQIQSATLSAGSSQSSHTHITAPKASTSSNVSFPPVSTVPMNAHAFPTQSTATTGYFVQPAGATATLVTGPSVAALESASVGSGQTTEHTTTSKRPADYETSDNVSTKRIKIENSEQSFPTSSAASTIHDAPTTISPVSTIPTTVAVSQSSSTTY